MYWLIVFIKESVLFDPCGNIMVPCYITLGICKLIQLTCQDWEQSNNVHPIELALYTTFTEYSSLWAFVCVHSTVTAGLKQDWTAADLNSWLQLKKDCYVFC